MGKVQLQCSGGPQMQKAQFWECTASPCVVLCFFVVQTYCEMFVLKQLFLLKGTRNWEGCWAV